MFTRYSDIDVPQNYSGNRFRNRSIENTEMKVHTNHTQSATKSSISPSFENQFNNEQIQKNEEEHVLEDIETVDDVVENEDYVDDSIEPDEKIEEENTILASQENDTKGIGSVSKSILEDLSLSPITEYLKSIKGEDLLLIALIIFLVSDKNVSNNDIIILLALLLVYHT